MASTSESSSIKPFNPSPHGEDFKLVETHERFFKSFEADVKPPEDKGNAVWYIQFLYGFSMLLTFNV